MRIPRDRFRPMMPPENGREGDPESEGWVGVPEEMRDLVRRCRLNTSG